MDRRKMMKSTARKKQSQEEPRTWRKSEGRRSEMEKVRREKMQVREKVGKSRNTVFFSMFCGSGGSKSRLTEAAGSEPAGQMKDEHLHADVARSAFGSENAQNTSCSEDFWKSRWQKVCTPMWREAHVMWKWKRTKHIMLGRLLEVEMSIKCTPMWREAHLEVKSVTNGRF